MENNPSIHDKPTLIVNQVMPQDSVGKDFWLIPVLKNLFNIVNISQGLGSSKAKLGIRNPVVSIEFCHYLPDKAEKSCSSTFVKQEEGNVPEKKRIFKGMQMRSFASLALVTAWGSRNTGAEQNTKAYIEYGT